MNITFVTNVDNNNDARAPSRVWHAFKTGKERTEGIREYG